MTKMWPIKQDPIALDRHAWALKYGQDLREMPNLPDVDAATPEQRAAAIDLLTRTEAGTAAYADPAAAEAAGYTRIGAVVRAGQNPGIVAAMEALAAAMPDNMEMLHISNVRDSSAVLDPNAPEHLMYAYPGQWRLEARRSHVRGRRRLPGTAAHSGRSDHSLALPQPHRRPALGDASVLRSA